MVQIEMTINGRAFTKIDEDELRMITDALEEAANMRPHGEETTLHGCGIARRRLKTRILDDYRETHYISPAVLAERSINGFS